MVTLSKAAFFFCKLPGGQVIRHLPPEHGDFIFDARLLPLQRLFGDALDRDHLSRGLLPSHHHFGKRTAAREEEKNDCFICAGAILTQKNLITCEWIEGTQRQTGQSTQTAYCEYLLRTGKVPDHGRQPSVLAYARRSCAAKSTANTFKTSEKTTTPI